MVEAHHPVSSPVRRSSFLGSSFIGSSLIGSAVDGSGEARVTLRGELDPDAVARLDAHLEGFLAARTRFITIDATAVSGADPRLLEVLTQTQHRLAPRRGMLSVLGLHPTVVYPASTDPPDRPPSPRTTPVGATVPAGGLRTRPSTGAVQ